MDVPEFYTAVTSLLLPANEKNKWVGMKTLGQLKWERNIRNEVSLMDPVLLAGALINACLSCRSIAIICTLRSSGNHVLPFRWSFRGPCRWRCPTETDPK